MKVLTDWATGKPPCEGYWLTRCGSYDTPHLVYWHGAFWDDDMPVCDTEWCGLAFNPESAAIGWDIANGCSGLIITEYAP